MLFESIQTKADYVIVSSLYEMPEQSKKKSVKKFSGNLYAKYEKCEAKHFQWALESTGKCLRWHKNVKENGLIKWNSFLLHEIISKLVEVNFAIFFVAQLLRHPRKK